MSYDLDISYPDTETHEGRRMSFNYTFNLSPFFYDVLLDPMGDRKAGGLKMLHGKTGMESVPVFKECFEEINRIYASMCHPVEGDKAFAAKYDAKNNWGSTIGAILLLHNMYQAAIDLPGGTWRVS